MDSTALARVAVSGALNWATSIAGGGRFIRGAVSRVSRPFYSADAPYFTATAYDALDRPVTITEPRAIIHAVGMQLDSKTRVLKLSSQVRGEFTSQK